MNNARLRSGFVHLLLPAVLAGSFAAFVTDGSAAWPFVAYNMYARLPLERPRTYRFEAVTAGGERIELDQDSFFRPYHRQDFVTMLNRQYPREAGTAAALAPVLTRAAPGRVPLARLTISRVSWESGPDGPVTTTILSGEKP